MHFLKKVQNPNNSVCYTQSSEPFRIYKIIGIPAPQLEVV
jgi:hypothetical protein